MAVDEIPLHHYKSMTPFWPGIHENQTGNGACRIRIYKRMYWVIFKPKDNWPHHKEGWSPFLLSWFNFNPSMDK